MSVRLLAHPLSRAPEVRALEACARVVQPATLSFEYRLHAPREAVAIAPRAMQPQFRDELWRHSCFEAFLAAPGRPEYAELNFAPSGDWACYGFCGYRSGGRSLTEISAPRIEAAWNEPRSCFTLVAQLDVAAIAAMLPAAFAGDAQPGRSSEAAAQRVSPRLELALSAVVETAQGALSYWALRHPAAKPDFHDRAGFVGALDSDASRAGS